MLQAAERICIAALVSGMSGPDVFIIGGGPAGLAAAIAARQKGWSVVVTDGNRPPIDKACGEGLMPDSLRAAARLGIDIPDSIGFGFRGIRFHGAGRSVEAEFPRGRGIGVRRERLHEMLVERAVQAGVELRWGAAATGIDNLGARWIIGADGSGSRVRHWAGLDTYIRNSRRFACRRHYALAPWTDCVEVYWGEGCQVYVTPVGPCEVCVALISGAPQLRLPDALRNFFPELDERLASAPASSRDRGAITANMRLERVARGNVALAGDASGSVDAVSGDGLCLSFKQAAALTEAIGRGDLASYNRAHPQLAMRPNLMTKTMLLMDRGPAIRRWAFGAMSAQPWIFEKLLAVHVA
jgi:menaquinone-9 beta-reductase